MNPKQFLLAGGVVLVLVGLLGFFGVIGPTGEESLFGDAWWFDNAENWAHTVLGVVAVLAGLALGAEGQKPLVVVVGVVALLVGVYGMFKPDLLGANLENPADTILHLVVGLWALVAGLGKKGVMVMS